MSFTRWERGAAAMPMPVDLAVLLVAAVARQSTSTTAWTQALLDRRVAVRGLLHPAGGAFNAGTAALLERARAL